MIHQPIGDLSQSKIVDFVMESNELMTVRAAMERIYAEKTGKPLRVVVEDLDRDFFMSATEAQDHGIVDFIATSDSEIFNF